MDLKWTIFVFVAFAGCVDNEPATETPTSTPVASPSESAPIDLASFGVNGDPFLGNPDAEVQVIAYEAPGCSSCKRYHGNGYQEVKADFIDTGKIGYHYLQWKVGYSYDIAGGIAEECAHREGGTDAYLYVLDEVFANQGKTEQLPRILSDAAIQFQLDNVALQECYENEETLPEVNEDIAKGKESGAGSNPGFAIIKGNEVKIVRGSSGPYDAIKNML